MNTATFCDCAACMSALPGMAGIQWVTADLVEEDDMGRRKRRSKGERKRQREIRRKRRASGGPSRGQLRRRVKARKKTSRVERRQARRSAKTRTKAIRREQRTERRQTRKTERKARKTERRQSRETRRATRRIGRAERRGPATDAAEQQVLIDQAEQFPGGRSDGSEQSALVATTGANSVLVPALAAVGIVGLAWYVKQRRRSAKLRGRK